MKDLGSTQVFIGLMGVTFAIAFASRALQTKLDASTAAISAAAKACAGAKP